ncbi:MAG: lamin tail domain-containing protein, partial [Nanoarchaeota archaeon]
MKKSAVKQGLFAFLAVLLFISMAGFASADISINEFLPNSVNTNYEWIELFNNGTSAVNLSDFNVSEDAASANFTIGDVVIAANGFIVLVRNETNFNQTYNLSGVTLIEYGPTVPSLNLNDGGDSIFLYNASLVNSILSYGDPGEN